MKRSQDEPRTSSSAASRERAAWLSWHDGTRSRSLARLLGVPLLTFPGPESGAWRHLSGGAWTLGQLVRVRPHVVFLQNSFVLLLVAACYKAVARGVVVVVDCHNKSLKRRLEGAFGSVFWQLKSWSFRRADLVVVSNRSLLPLAHALSPRVAVLRDPLPAVPEDHVDDAPPFPSTVPPCPYVLLPCSFEEDEPADVILAVASQLAAEGATVVMTGREARRRVQGSGAAHPALLTPGHVPEPEYNRLLVRASVVVSLTGDPDCLMCSAYEAVAARKPLVLSDTPALRNCFRGCASFVPNSVPAVADAVRALLMKPRTPGAESLEGFRRAFGEEYEAFLASIDELVA